MQRIMKPIISILLALCLCFSISIMNIHAENESTTETDEITEKLEEQENADQIKEPEQQDETDKSENEPSIEESSQTEEKEEDQSSESSYSSKSSEKNTEKEKEIPKLKATGRSVKGQDADVGESVYIGTYPQSLVSDASLIAQLNKLDVDGSNDVTYKKNKYRTKNNKWYKYEPIEWVVLSNDNGKAVLVSKIVLETKAFYEGSGEWKHVYYQSSTIRKWLNNQFIDTAFTSDESNEIVVSRIANSEGDETQDKVYLPLQSDLSSLSTLKCGYSDYVEEIWPAYYWTRYTWSAFFGYVDVITLSNGSRAYSWEDDSTILYGVRPCMKANINNIPPSSVDEDDDTEEDMFIQRQITATINGGYLSDFMSLYTVDEDAKTESALFSTDFFLNPTYHPYNFLKYSALASASTYAPAMYKSTITLLKDSGFKGFNSKDPQCVFSGEYSLNDNEKCTTKSSKDCNHHCTVYTGKQNYQGKTIIALVISGYTDSGYEWRSNFEIGDYEYHEGFKSAADEVMNLIQTEYADALKSSDCMFWITGHSRGGAITNLVAAELNRRIGEDKVFAYGFATPNVAKASEVKNYTNIINIVNDGDFVPYVAPYEWNYRKNGITITFDATHNSEIKKLYKKYSGLTYTGTSSRQRYKLMEKFVNVGKSQTGYYSEIITGTDSNFYKPVQYCQEGLAELANTKSGSKIKGIKFMLIKCLNQKEVRSLNGVLIGQEVGEVVSAQIDKLAEDPAYFNKGLGAFLAAHHMEAYLAYVNSEQCEKDINGNHSSYINVTKKEYTSPVDVIDDISFEVKIFHTVSKASWTSSNAKVANVSGDGTVRCLSFGTATITGTCDGKTYTCKVTYKGKNGNEFVIYKGETKQFNAKDIGAGYESLNLPEVSEFKWKSSDKKIASIDSKGFITGEKAGTVTITATKDGYKYTRKVVVKNCTLKLNKTKATIKKGKTFQIKATPTPAATVTYKTSNKKVATVSKKGLVKGIKKGTATITVKANGISKKIKITVKK